MILSKYIRHESLIFFNIFAEILFRAECENPKGVRYSQDIYHLQNDKINTVDKIIKFFENNYNIQISNKNLKVKNIINSTSFKFLQEMENKEGFNESVNEQFFAVGKKEQWKIQLDKGQIKLIENKFKNLMQKLNYNVSN